MALGFRIALILGVASSLATLLIIAWRRRHARLRTSDLTHRQCVRCMYPVEPTAAVCPECGASMSALRARWWLRVILRAGVTGSVVAAATIITVAVLRVQQWGTIALVPNWAIGRLLPSPWEYSGAWELAASVELHRRLDSGEMTASEIIAAIQSRFRAASPIEVEPEFALKDGQVRFNIRANPELLASSFPYVTGPRFEMRLMVRQGTMVDSTILSMSGVASDGTSATVVVDQPEFEYWVECWIHESESYARIPVTRPAIARLLDIPQLRTQKLAHSMVGKLEDWLRSNEYFITRDFLLIGIQGRPGVDVRVGVAAEVRLLRDGQCVARTHWAWSFDPMQLSMAPQAGTPVMWKWDDASAPVVDASQVSGNDSTFQWTDDGGHARLSSLTGTWQMEIEASEATIELESNVPSHQWPPDVNWWIGDVVLPIAPSEVPSAPATAGGAFGRKVSLGGNLPLRRFPIGGFLERAVGSTSE